MCKQLKRLTDLSKCPHLNKTDRDAVTWAIYQIEPPKVEPEKGFDGFDFSMWPCVPDKKSFDELIKARKSKHGVIMSQAYIDAATPHMHELIAGNISIQKAIQIATMNGWQGFKAKWVMNEVEVKAEEAATEIKTALDVFALLKKRQLTSVKQIPIPIKKVMEMMYRNKKYPEHIMIQLKNIGF